MFILTFGAESAGTAASRTSARSEVGGVFAAKPGAGTRSPLANRRGRLPSPSLPLPVIASGAKQSRGRAIAGRRPGLLRRLTLLAMTVWALLAMMAGHVIAPPRHCERSEAIQRSGACKAASWIASSLDAPRNDDAGFRAMMAGHVIAPPRHCPTPSLRAERSNPEVGRLQSGVLDCFVA